MRLTLLVLITFGLAAPGFAAHTSGNEGTDVLALQGVTISAEKRREMMARLLRIGMSNIRSDRIEDAHKIVCELRERTGSHLKDLVCGTNAALNLQREINFTLNSGMIAQLTFSPRVSSNGRRMVRQGTPSVGARAASKTTSPASLQNVVTMRAVSRGKIQSLINEYAADVSDEKNRALLERDMIWSNFVGTDSRHKFSADELTAFVQAYKAVNAIEDSAPDNANIEARLQQEVSRHGLSVNEYNEILDLVMKDDDLRARVIAALDVNI